MAVDGVFAKTAYIKAIFYQNIITLLALIPKVTLSIHRGSPPAVSFLCMLCTFYIYSCTYKSIMLLKYRLRDHGKCSVKFGIKLRNWLHVRFGTKSIQWQGLGVKHFLFAIMLLRNGFSGASMIKI